MITKELNGGRIRVARTEMDYKHGNRTLTSVYPLEGPGTYEKVMQAISKGKLLRPTTAQTFSLIDFALNNPDDEQCKDIVSTVKSRWLWTATENLWGQDDVILYDNVDGQMPSDRESLLKRLKDGDKAVRVVPYGFRTGSQSVSDLVANPYIIGQIGDKDVVEEVVARVDKKVRRVDKKVSRFNPFVCALGSQDSEVHTYTAIGSGWGDGKLHVDGGHDVGQWGSASGVLPESAEGA